ncbi:hypothetical protein [Streptomyces hyaluromycini]|uniref:hypothetical protein n=1 Tax=Streptomyces hyaluromycini TaxID=1377993 RepID=UPI00142D5BE6|nr:hypothetical protein [Streptomyces hyaluromycini]
MTGAATAHDLLQPLPLLVIRDRQPNRPNATGRTRNWKEAINTLAGYYGDRVTDHQ